MMLDATRVIAWNSMVLIAGLCFLELVVLLVKAITKGIREIWRG